MRRASPARSALLFFAVLTGAATLPPRSIAVAAPGADAERAAKDLDDPRWEVRCAASAALLVEGRSALAEALADSSPAAGARLARWLATVDARLLSGSPTASARARAALAVVETEASPAAVRGSPVLLRERIRRLLPGAAVPRLPALDDGDDDGGIFSSLGEAAAAAREELVQLLPEARAPLLERIARSREPAEVAGAISVLFGEVDEAMEAAIAARFEADPAAIEGVRALDTPGASVEASVAVGLALSLHGRPADARRFDRPYTDLAALVRERLKARGDSDLTTGSFLGEVGEGRATPADAEEAARRIAALGLPHHARLAARRALFLDAKNERARRILVDADVALGLLATAKRDASPATPLPSGTGGGEDDPAARALDEALRAGRFAERLAWRLELGFTRNFGSPPVAVGEGVVACGRPDGRVLLLDPATGTERASLRTAPMSRESMENGAGRLPRGLAIAKGRLAAISGRGRLFLWTLASPDEPLSDTGGPFEAVTAGPDGSFWVASAGRRIHRVAPGAVAPTAVASVPFHPDVAPFALRAFSDGALLLQSGATLERIDPAKGTVVELFSGTEMPACAPYGDALLLGLGSRWAIVRDGERVRFRDAPDEGEIAGIAGDPASDVVYLTLVSETVALRAKDGRVLWRGSVGGSAAPVLGEGVLVVPSGSGDERFGGNGRSERTLYALTTARPPHDLFAEATIARLLEAATAAVKEGRVQVGVLMLDLVRDWVGEDLAAFDAAVRAATPRDPAAQDDAEEPPPEPAPEPEPPPAAEPPPVAPEDPPAPVPNPGGR